MPKWAFVEYFQSQTEEYKGETLTLSYAKGTRSLCVWKQELKNKGIELFYASTECFCLYARWQGKTFNLERDNWSEYDGEIPVRFQLVESQPYSTVAALFGVASSCKKAHKLSYAIVRDAYARGERISALEAWKETDQSTETNNGFDYCVLSCPVV